MNYRENGRRGVRDEKKQQLRDEIRQRLRDYDEERRFRASRAVTERLVASPVWAAADTLFAFVSLPDEIETTELCRHALASGKRLGLPRFGRDGLVFHLVTDLDALRVDNSLAIRQPAKDLPVLASTLNPRQPGRLLIATPGRAFTRQGGRLGRGGGFYDAFFAALHHGKIVYHSVGLCFDEQLVADLPVDETDEPVNGVITPGDRFGAV